MGTTKAIAGANEIGFARLKVCAAEEGFRKCLDQILVLEGNCPVDTQSLCGVDTQHLLNQSRIFTNPRKNRTSAGLNPFFFNSFIPFHTPVFFHSHLRSRGS